MAGDPLDGFPVRVEIPIAWGEMDAFGHVNNVAYFRYFESARIACFSAEGSGRIVSYDYERKRKAPLQATLRERLGQLESCA